MFVASVHYALHAVHYAPITEMRDFFGFKEKDNSYEPNMFWNILFIKSYHKIQLFVRPFNFKINILENKKTHCLL